MRYYTVLFVLLISRLSLSGQAPSWQWAQGVTGGGIYGNRTSVCADDDGNIYVTGCFSEATISFGAVVLTNADGVNYTSDVFVVKYDFAGNVIWAKSFGGTNDDLGVSICADHSGSLFMTGQYNSTSWLMGTVGLVNADNSGNTSDLFIARLDTAGNVIWAKSGNGSSWDYINQVTTDLWGNVYVIGNYGSNNFLLGTTSLPNNGNTGDDIFVAKYAQSGNLQWANHFGSGSGGDQGFGVATDSIGKIYISGSFNSSTINFGSITLTKSAGVYADIFIAKLDSTGIPLWANGAGGIWDDWSYGLAIDGQANVCAVGVFYSASITLGTTLHANSNTSGSSGDLFITKLDSSGNYIWSKAAGTANVDDWATCVTSDSIGNFYISGYFGGASITFNTTTVSGPGYGDVFVAKFDNGGNCNWAIAAGGGTDLEMASGICTYGSADVYVTGSYASPTASFGPITLSNPNGGFPMLFTAKINGLLGVTDLAIGNSQLKIFPVPSNGIFTIESGSFLQSIVIYDVQGNTVCEIPQSGNSASVDLTLQPNGCYLINVLTDEGGSCIRVIKE